METTTRTTTRTSTRTSRPRRRHHDAGVLRAVPAFRGADPRRLAELATHTDRLRLPPGRTLVKAGETARELVVVVAGEAAAHHDGTTTVLRPGAQLGGAEVVRHERHPATVITTTEVEVVVVYGPAVLWAVREGLVGALDRQAREAPGHPAGTGSRGAGSRGPATRGAGSRGPATRGAGTRGPATRGAGTRGPATRGAGHRSAARPGRQARTEREPVTS